MQKLNIREMRANLGRLDQIVNDAGEIIIQRHGTPIARLLPIQGHRALPTHAELRSQVDQITPSASDLIRMDRDAR
jgi:prevent-host-death family protein